MLVRAANIQDHVVVEWLAIALAQQEGSCGREGGNILSGDQVFVAEIGAAIVGAAVVHKHDDAHWQLTLLYVTGGHRLSGIGRALVHAVIDHTDPDVELFVSSTIGAKLSTRK